MRPAFRPGLLIAWRDQDTLQLGVDPRRAIAMTGLGGYAAMLTLLDGSRDVNQVLDAAQRRGVPRAAADRVIALLAAAGVVEDFPAATFRALPDGPRARLASELAAASLAYGQSDGGARILARRRAARVRVYGSGPVASPMASLLTDSGVGQVSSVTLAPRPRARAGRAAAGRQPDLAVLAGGYPAELPGQLAAAGVAHLAASAGEAIGVVGPLVIPGRSACLNCLELARRDRDPAWPLILAQVAGRTAAPAACSAALAAAVAAQAAGQVLSVIDLARPAAPVTNGTLELVLPGWQWRRRSWAPHPGCRCSRRSGT